MWVLWLVLGALGGARLFLGYASPSPRPETLSAREVATLDAVAEALFPAGGGIGPSGREAGVAAYADRLASASQPRQRLLMRALFFLVEHATLVFPAPGGLSGFRRFSSLSLSQRTAAIESWQRSPIFLRRLVFTSLRAVCTLGYLAHPAVLRELRLAPHAIETPIVEADLLYPRIGERSDSVTLDASDLTPPGEASPIDLDGPLREGYAEGTS